MWVSNSASATVDRIDPETSTVRQTIRVGRGPDDVTVGAGSVWVANGLDGSVSRIDPGSNDETQRIHVGAGPSGMAFGFRSLWVVTRDAHQLVRVDAASGAVTRRTRVGTGPAHVAAGYGSLWITSSADGKAIRVDPKTGDVVEEVNVGRGPGAIAVGAGSVWVANTIDGTLSRVDPDRGAVTATIPVGEGPSGVAVTDEAVWVTNEHASSLSRVDPATNEVTRTVPLGVRPAGLTTSGTVLYVAVRPSGAAHRGGTLTFVEEEAWRDSYTSLDPALFSPAMARAILLAYDGLTTFKRTGGLESAEVAPNLATAIPTPTDGGRTYTFRLRPGTRYSNGTPLRASDFRHAFERVFELREEYGMFFLEALVGAKKCATRRGPCDLSAGVVADDASRTVTLRLTRPDPELPAKLAFSMFVAVPGSAPSRDVGRRPLPGTGPYVVASLVPGRQLRLVRNPHFRERTPARPAGYVDEIVIRIDVPEQRRVATVARGQADATSLLRAAGSGAARSLRARYGSRVHVNPSQGAISIMLNTKAPPFDDVRVRRAVNLALDRDAVVRAAGGSEMAAATCQVLPPNFPGHRPRCPYRIDLAKARALVEAAGARGASVELLTREFARAITGPVVAAFRAAGLRVTPTFVGDNEYFDVLQRRRVNAAVWGWVADYPSAYTWIPPQFSCDGHPLGFCDRTLDRAMERAARLGRSDPSAANEAWARVDRQITDRAPFVPLLVAQVPYLVSERVGNYQYSPVYELLLDQVWVR